MHQLIERKQAEIRKVHPGLSGFSETVKRMDIKDIPGIRKYAVSHRDYMYIVGGTNRVNAWAQIHILSCNVNFNKCIARLEILCDNFVCTSSGDWMEAIRE